MTTSEQKRQQRKEVTIAAFIRRRVLKKHQERVKVYRYVSALMRYERMVTNG